MSNATTVALAKVAAYPVVLNPVAVRSGVKRNTTASSTTTTILGDVIVMNANPVVFGIFIIEIAVTLLDGDVRMAKTDATAVNTSVGIQAIVANRKSSA